MGRVFCLLIVKHVQENLMAQVQLLTMTKTTMGYAIMMKLRDVWMRLRAITMTRPRTMVEDAFIPLDATIAQAIQMEAGQF